MVRIEQGATMPAASAAPANASPDRTSGDSGVATYAIGDVHGCTQTLRRLIDQLVVDEHAHRSIVFADTIDAAGEVEFGAEGDLEESVGA